jgi:flagellar assembly factor FliW
MEFDVVSSIHGFEDIKRVELSKIDDFFMKIENMNDEKKVSFMLVNPFLVREYAFDLPSSFKQMLELSENSNMLVANVMIMANPIEDSSVNFIAPFIFNFDTSKVAQVILDSNKYPDFGLIEPISRYIDLN